MSHSVMLTVKKPSENRKKYRVISIRMKSDLWNRINELSSSTNRSRNEVINILLGETVERVRVME